MRGKGRTWAIDVGAAPRMRSGNLTGSEIQMGFYSDFEALGHIRHCVCPP